MEFCTGVGRKVLIEKMTLEERPEGSKIVSHVPIWGTYILEESYIPRRMVEEEE